MTDDHKDPMTHTLDPLDLTGKEIQMCGDVLSKYLLRHVENHFQWSASPWFGPEFDVIGKEVFAERWCDRVSEGMRKYAERLAVFLHQSYLEFKLGVELEYQNICPHCHSIHTFVYLTADGLTWTVWCENCAKQIACEEDNSGV
jgi:hypothetical protein